MKHNKSAVIAGVGSYLPEQVITNKEVDTRLDGNGYPNLGSMVENITGVIERRYAPDGVQASDLAVLAAKDSLQNAGISPEDVDTIFYSSCSRDVAEPATANLVQAKLGAINATRVMDVTNACNSFLFGLAVNEVEREKHRYGCTKSMLISKNFADDAIILANERECKVVDRLAISKWIYDFQRND